MSVHEVHARLINEIKEEVAACYGVAVADIDSTRMQLRVAHGKGAKQRTLVVMQQEPHDCLARSNLEDALAGNGHTGTSRTSVLMDRR